MNIPNRNSLTIASARPGRRLLATLALLCGIAAADTHAAEIGVNFNGMLNRIDQGDLARTETTWIRGFVDYYQFRSGQKNVVTDPGLQALYEAHQAGYQTIINIKFDFTSKNFPTTTAAIDTELTISTRCSPRSIPIPTSS